MQENIEVNNPMYVQDDIDDEDIHLDRSFPLQEKVIYNTYIYWMYLMSLYMVFFLIIMD